MRVGHGVWTQGSPKSWWRSGSQDPPSLGFTAAREAVTVEEWTIFHLGLDPGIQFALPERSSVLSRKHAHSPTLVGPAPSSHDASLASSTHTSFRRGWSGLFEPVSRVNGPVECLFHHRWSPACPRSYGCCRYVHSSGCWSKSNRVSPRTGRLFRAIRYVYHASGSVR